MLFFYVLRPNPWESAWSLLCLAHVVQGQILLASPSDPWQSLQLLITPCCIITWSKPLLSVMWVVEWPLDHNLCDSYLHYSPCSHSSQSNPSKIQMGSHFPFTKTLSGLPIHFKVLMAFVLVITSHPFPAFSGLTVPGALPSPTVGAGKWCICSLLWVSSQMPPRQRGLPVPHTQTCLLFFALLS